MTVDPGGHSATDGHRAVQDVATLKDRPTAVFATNDSLGIGAMRWCLENGLSVPGDMAIVGYDNTEAAAFSAVPMTSVHYAADEVSEHAVERIVSMIRGGPTAKSPMMTLIDPELVVRNST